MKKKKIKIKSEKKLKKKKIKSLNSKLDSSSEVEEFGTVTVLKSGTSLAALVLALDANSSPGPTY